MKKVLLFTLLGLACQASEWGSTNGELRGMSFDRSFDGVAPHSRAVTLGGVLRYQTPIYNDLSATIGYYGSFNTNAYSDAEGRGTAMLQPNGNDISFLGEASVKYDNGTVQAIAGRQRLSTPMANDHDLRLLPSVYQGVTAMYKPYGIQIGHITKYSGFGSKYSGFQDIPTFDFLSFSKYNINAQAIHSDPRDYYYGDYTHAIGNLTFKAQAGANDNHGGKDSTMYGAKGTYVIGSNSLSILGNEIQGNRWLSIESGAMFSDWMQGYGLYEPSKALGVQLANTLGSFSTTIGAVKVSGGVVDDYVEYQGDLIWQATKQQKLRLRYSEKHQTAESLREDRNDLRVIYYYGF